MVRKRQVPRSVFGESNSTLCDSTRALLASDFFVENKDVSNRLRDHPIARRQRTNTRDNGRIRPDLPASICLSSSDAIDFLNRLKLATISTIVIEQANIRIAAA